MKFEVFFNYKPRSNGELLRLYGFIEPGNTMKYAYLDVELGLKDPHFKLKTSLINRYQLERYLPFQCQTSTAQSILMQILQRVITCLRVMYPTT